MRQVFGIKNGPGTHHKCRGHQWLSPRDWGVHRGARLQICCGCCLYCAFFARAKELVRMRRPKFYSLRRLRLWVGHNSTYPPSAMLREPEFGFGPPPAAKLSSGQPPNLGQVSSEIESIEQVDDMRHDRTPLSDLRANVLPIGFSRISPQGKSCCNSVSWGVADEINRPRVKSRLNSANAGAPGAANGVKQ